MATLIKIDRNGSKHWEGLMTCDRCQGRGWFATGVCNGQLVPARPDNAVCYKCLGLGKVHGKWIERTPEYQAKLDAKREAKLAKERAEREARQAAIEAERAERERLEAEAKAAEAARIAALKAISQYVGEPGTKLTFSGTFDHTAWFTGHDPFGREEKIFIHSFKDDAGNKIVWKTQKGIRQDIQEGDRVTVTGTVKEHREYKDEKQTALIRCKVTKEE